MHFDLAITDNILQNTILYVCSVTFMPWLNVQFVKLVFFSNCFFTLMYSMSSH